jgi:hypothetical protein
MVTHPEGEADHDRLCYRYLQQQQQFSFFYRQCRYLRGDLLCATADRAAVSGSIGVVKRAKSYTRSG